MLSSYQSQSDDEIEPHHQSNEDTILVQDDQLESDDQPQKKSQPPISNVQIEEEEEENDDEDDDLIKIKLPSKRTTVSYSYFSKYSKVIRNEYNEMKAREEISPLVNEYIQQYNIKEDNVILFFKLINNENGEISNMNFFDLWKLASLFKVTRLLKLFSKFEAKYKNDVKFISKSILEENSMKKVGYKSNEENREEIETALVSQIDECLENEEFNKLPISFIKNIIEKSDRENINNDKLYEFILKNLSERYGLLEFVDIEKLSDEHLLDIYSKSQDDEYSRKKELFQAIGQSVKYYIKTREKERIEDSKIEELSSENEKKRKMIEETMNQINECEKLNSTLFEESKLLEAEESELIDQTNMLESELNQIKRIENENEIYFEIFYGLMKKRNDDEIRADKINGILTKIAFSYKTILNCACEAGNSKLARFLITLDKVDINERSVFYCLFVHDVSFK